ncbi:MAG TPA: isochorismatase family protein, partial [Usitatibacter sp.]
MTDNIDIGWLFVALAGLCACSAFFAMSETCLMALNRYRLKHLIREGSRGARLAGSLLDRTDELLAFILAGNTLINAAITILVAETCRRLLGTGDYVLAVATLSAGFFILVFAEILPKVIGATYAEPLALGAAYLLAPLVKFTRWPMWFVNVFVKAILNVLRIRPRNSDKQHLSMAELRTLVLEGGKFIPKKHQSIFLNLFELEDMTVDDTMTPRGQIEHLDLEDDVEQIRNALATAHHTRLVVTEGGGLDNVVGILHVRKVVNATRREQIDVEGLRAIMREPYYVPEGTALLVFDLLEGHVNRDAESKARFAPVIANAARLLGAARGAGAMVAYANADHRADRATSARTLRDADNRLRPLADDDPDAPLLTGGTHEASIVRELAPRSGDFLVPKHRWSAFHGTYLDLALRTRKVDTIVVTGGSTDVGVASTAFAARDLDYNLVIASDACTSPEQDNHDQLMRRMFPRMAR